MKNPLEIFQKEAPEVQHANFIDSLVALKSLDQKTKQLIHIGMKLVCDDENAITCHITMAKAAGASQEEIKETILLSLMFFGLSKPPAI